MAIPHGPDLEAGGGSTLGRLRQAFLTGTALTIPLVLTLVVLQIALNLVGNVVSPIVDGLEFAFGGLPAPAVLVEAVTVLTLGAVILFIGLAAEHRAGRGRFSDGFDALMARIPGLGSVYTGIRRMSDVLLEQDTQSFREVTLVEFPRESTYMLAFVTAEPPEAVHDAADVDDLRTPFVPLAPNPVMGGFLVNLPVDRVHDIDLTVEEGIQAIVTSGTAIDPRVDDVDAEAMPSLSDADILDGDVLDGDVLGGDVLSGRDDEGDEFG